MYQYKNILKLCLQKRLEAIRDDYYFVSFFLPPSQLYHKYLSSSPVSIVILWQN